MSKALSPPLAGIQLPERNCGGCQCGHCSSRHGGRGAWGPCANTRLCGGASAPSQGARRQPCSPGALPGVVLPPGLGRGQGQRGPLRAVRQLAQTKVGKTLPPTWLQGSTCRDTPCPSSITPWGDGALCSCPKALIPLPELPGSQSAAGSLGGFCWALSMRLILRHAGPSPTQSLACIFAYGRLDTPDSSTAIFQNWALNFKRERGGWVSGKDRKGQLDSSWRAVP